MYKVGYGLKTNNQITLIMKKQHYLKPQTDTVLLQLEQSVATVSTLTLLDAIDSPNITEDTSGTSFIDY